MRQHEQEKTVGRRRITQRGGGCTDGKRAHAGGAGIAHEALDPSPAKPVDAFRIDAGQFMCLITASPNSEHLTLVTPGSPSAFMRRSKSYVTVLAEIAPSMPLMIRSAASVQPM